MIPIRKIVGHMQVSTDLVFDGVRRGTRNNCGVVLDGGRFNRIACFIHTRYSAECAGDFVELMGQRIRAALDANGGEDEALT